MVLYRFQELIRRFGGSRKPEDRSRQLKVKKLENEYFRSKKTV
jgi:hypothetical protein